MKPVVVKRLAALWFIGWAVFSLPLAEFRARPRFRHLNMNPVHGIRSADALRNLTYYVPAGILGVELGLATAPAVIVGATLSVVAETSQLFARERVPSITDIILNTAGAAIGAVVWTMRRRRLRTSRATVVEFAATGTGS